MSNMEIDRYLTRIGEFGKFQRIHYFLLSLIGFVGAFSTMSYVFLVAEPAHWCATPVYISNLSLEERKAVSLPLDDRGEYSKCSIYNLSPWNSSDTVGYEASGWNSSSLPLNVSQLSTSRCSSWEYDTTFYSRTIVSEWNLVCGKQWVVASIGAGLGAGKTVCAFVTGALADRFGRKKLLVASLTIQCVVGVLSAFCPEPISFGIAMAIIGGSALASYQSAMVLGIEMVGVTWRVFAGIWINVMWTFGYLAVALIAYFIRDWSTLQIVLHVPMVIFVFLYAWFTPESARWLLQVNRETEAMCILKKMAETNGVEWDDKMKLILPAAGQDEKVEKVTLKAITKSRMMVVFTITSCFLWFCCNLLFFGLSYNTSNMAGNPYLNFALSGAVEFPALGCAYFLLNSRMGRRGSMFAGMLLSSVALLATVPIPSALGILSTVFAMVGKFAITAAFAIVFIYTPEFFPTAYRSLAVGISSTVGRIGVILAPYVTILGTVLFKELPLLVFGCVSLVATIMTLLLPETRAVPLPNTMDDLRNLRNTLLSCRKRSRASDTPEQELEYDMDDQESGSGKGDTTANEMRL